MFSGHYAERDAGLLRIATARTPVAGQYGCRREDKSRRNCHRPNIGRADDGRTGAVHQSVYVGRPGTSGRDRGVWTWKENFAGDI